MDRRRLILIGLLVIVTAAAAAYFLLGDGGGAQQQQVVPTAVPEPMVQIALAANNLPRGLEITLDNLVDTVLMQSWPEEQLPQGYFDSPDEIVGFYVRTELIPQGMPILRSMLSTTPETEPEGGEFARIIPEGRRAYAIPMDMLGAVAWTIEPGDHVDVLISWEIFELDEDFQTGLPNEYVCIGEEPCQGVYGRMELLPTGQTVMVYPNPLAATQNAYVAQLTIQDALVYAVGENLPGAPTIEGPEEPTPPQTDQGAAGGGDVVGGPADAEVQPTPIPEPTVPPAQVVVLVVSPQDVLILKAVTELQADIDLALRAEGDNEIVETEAVTLDYVLTYYGIAPPPKLPYGVSRPSVIPLAEEVIVEPTPPPAEEETAQ